MAQNQKRELTERQRIFVREYLKCGVGGEAARKAGCRKEVADAQAVAWQRIPKVQAAIAAGRAKVEEKGEVSREWAIRRLKEMSAEPDAKVGERVAALRLMSDMQGWEAPKKVEARIEGLTMTELLLIGRKALPGPVVEAEVLPEPVAALPLEGPQNAPGGPRSDESGDSGAAGHGVGLQNGKTFGQNGGAGA